MMMKMVVMLELIVFSIVSDDDGIVSADDGRGSDNDNTGDGSDDKSGSENYRWRW